MLPRWKIEQVMNQEQCDYSTACSILAKRANAVKKRKKRKQERETREEQQRRDFQRMMEKRKLD